jgi:ribonucleoside-diphosphate reductase alpha subunit
MQQTEEMRVIKRNGKIEVLSFDKILRRLREIGKKNGIKKNFTSLAIRVIDQLYTRIPTSKIDDLCATQCASLISSSRDYETLAVHITVSNHHRNTLGSFSDVMELLYEFRDMKGVHSPIVSEEFIRTVRASAEKLNAMIDYNRDYLFSYFGLKTLEKSYLMHISGRIVERPQHMWMRVSLGIHGYGPGALEGDAMLERVKETYDLMSTLKMTHATPTLFNSGTPRPQLSSCFLLAMDEDSIECIFKTVTDCARISKWSGGIGVAVSKIRAKSSIIRGTNGKSNGLVPMLKVFNSTSLYVDQCLLPESIVFTKELGPTAIENVHAGSGGGGGMHLFNSSGQPQRVAKVLEHEYRGPMVRLQSPYFRGDFQVTPDHPVAIFRLPEGVSTWEDALCDPFFDIEFVEAGRINPDRDMIAYSRPYLSAVGEDCQSRIDDDSRGEEGELDEEAMRNLYMVGLMAAAFREDGDKSFRSINVFHSASEIGRFVEEYLSGRCVEYRVAPGANGGSGPWAYSKYSWTDRLALPFQRADFLNESGELRIHPRWIQEADTFPKCTALLHGMMDGMQSVPVTGEFMMEHASASIILLVRFLAMRLGLPSRCFSYDVSFRTPPSSPSYSSADEECKGISPDALPETTHPGIPTTKMHVLNIPAVESICCLMGRPYHADLLVEAEVRHGRFYHKDQYILCPITSVEEVPEYSGVLYDLEMSAGSQHDYLTEFGLVHNGGGKRNGSFAIYLEPWHADIEDFLQLRKNHGDENQKARDLFYALWVPDLFMKRVKDDLTWTLMCPDECPGLADVHGQAFEDLYTKYEREKKGRTTIKARDLWTQILDAQQETGTPYLVYKDTANARSNQKNVGTIKSSNLCAEIIEYTNHEETAVCNLASISLPGCVQTASATDASAAAPATFFDFNVLHHVAKVATRNLNRVIDVNYYPTESTRRSNMRHRPVGLGTQGLYDVFQMMGFSFESKEARELNRNIFETIYHAALEASCELSTVLGPYETFVGSPASQGLLQFDLAGYDPDEGRSAPRYDWAALKTRIKEHGLRNSLLLAQMPTASTAQILNNVESCETITSNIFSRRTLAGEFIVVNKHLQKYLEDKGLWSDEIKNSIIASDGSVQHLDCLSAEMKGRFKTCWETSMRVLIDMAADRSKFICQSESLNLFIRDPSYASLTTMHFYGWNKGLKTGIYYLRRRGRASAQQFTIAPPASSSSLTTANNVSAAENAIGGGDEGASCSMCSA